MCSVNETLKESGSRVGNTSESDSSDLSTSDDSAGIEEHLSVCSEDTALESMNNPTEYTGDQDMITSDEVLLCSSVSYMLECKEFKLNYATIFTYNRIVGTWNSLPLSICEVASVNSFKALVRKFFMD